MGVKHIGFNKPYLTGRELDYIQEAVATKHISGNGIFTKKCQSFFEEKYNFKKCLLTTSCTDALEMAAILADIQPGDEVIMPSFTFVSTANAFVLRGAKIVFVDSRPDHPGMDETKLEDLITTKTKAIVCVHYAGVACDMDVLTKVCEKHNLFLIEDAAQAIDSHYKGKPLGSFGDFATFSFHETKNIQCGEGGLLVINNEKFIPRAEIIWEKGTNRASFFRGEVDKYGWLDVGSSFLPSELNAAFLWAQLENLEDIQTKRKAHWQNYYDAFSSSEITGALRLPTIPDFAENNGHLFYLVAENLEQRSNFIAKMKEKGVMSVFHYQSLHSSPYYKNQPQKGSFINSDRYSDCLVRLPLFYDLEIDLTTTIPHSLS